MKKRNLQILSIVLILIAIVCIWFYKNGSAETPADTTLDTSSLTVDTLDLVQLQELELPIILDFGADWCNPCQTFKPILEEFYVNMEGKAVVCYIDTEKSPEIAANFPVQVIPTQVFINADGTPYVPSEALAGIFTMYSLKDTNEHVFTVHQGILSYEQLEEIYEDMISNN